jgi:hypothetical protein
VLGGSASCGRRDRPAERLDFDAHPRASNSRRRIISLLFPKNINSITPDTHNSPLSPLSRLRPTDAGALIQLHFIRAPLIPPKVFREPTPWLLYVSTTSKHSLPHRHLTNAMPQQPPSQPRAYSQAYIPNGASQPSGPVPGARPLDPNQGRVQQVGHARVLCIADVRGTKKAASTYTEWEAHYKYRTPATA